MPPARAAKPPIFNALLQNYSNYVQRRGFHAFDTEHLKEGAWHYSLDGFINFFIQRLGGATDTLYTEETVRNKRLYTWIIRTDCKVPSRRVAKKPRKPRGE